MNNNSSLAIYQTNQQNNSDIKNEDISFNREFGSHFEGGVGPSVDNSQLLQKEDDEAQSSKKNKLISSFDAEDDDDDFASMQSSN